MHGVPRGVTCLACGGRFPAFARYGQRPRPGLCPGCGSKPRHRALLLFLRRFVRPRLRDGSEVLEIGPSRPATRFVPGRRTIGPARYTAVDLDRRPHHARLRPPHRFRRMDATRLRFGRGTFDVILCNNVLPFTPDDTAILAEVRRCLKPGGVAMVDVDVQVARTTAAASLQAARSWPLHGRVRRDQRLSPLLRARLPRAPPASGTRAAPLRSAPGPRSLVPARARPQGRRARVPRVFEPGRRPGVRPGGARAGQRIFLSFPTTVRSTSPSRTRE